MNLRPKLPPRSIDELYRLPMHATLTAEEASLITRLTVSALAVRRCKRKWPPFERFDRMIRYRLGDLLTPGSEAGVNIAEGLPEIPTSPMPSRFT